MVWVTISVCFLLGDWRIPFLVLSSQHVQKKSTVQSNGSSIAKTLHWQMLFLIVDRTERSTPLLNRSQHNEQTELFIAISAQRSW